MKLNVQNAEMIKKSQKMFMKDTKDIFVAESAMPNFAKHFHQTSKMPIEVLGALVKASRFTIADMSKATQNAYHTSRLNDTHGSKVRKVRILLRSGLNFVARKIGDAGIVIGAGSSRKTISSLFRSAAQMILQTFNRSVAPAIAVSGRSFNIYENPELIKN